MGSDSERLRQRILETEVRTLSDVEASGSRQQDGDTEDDDAVERDEIETEAARKKAKVAKKNTEAAAKKAAEKEAEEARKAKRVAEVAKEKTAKEKRIKERERVKERERREEEERESRRKRTRSGSGSLFMKRETGTGSRSRSRSRSRWGSESELRHGSGSMVGSRTASLDNAVSRTQGERLTGKRKYTENRRWHNLVANEEQYFHQVRVIQLCVEDVRKQLEDHFGSKKDVPEKIEEAVKICEKEIDNRI